MTNHDLAMFVVACACFGVAWLCFRVATHSARTPGHRLTHK